MPRQHELPHTAPQPGPCDRQRDALQDATEAATEAAAEKKRALAALLDRMQETGVSRVSVTDHKTGKRKWLEITADPKLRSVKAETDSESPADRKRRSRTSGEPETGPTLAPERAGGEDATAGWSDGNARTGQEDDDLGHEATVEQTDTASPDLRTPGQQRKRRR